VVIKNCIIHHRSAAHSSSAPDGAEHDAAAVSVLFLADVDQFCDIYDHAFCLCTFNRFSE